MSKSSLTPVRNHDVLLDSLEDAMETPKRMANKSEARDLKFGILHPGGPQTPTTMSKSSLTPVRNHDVLLDSLEDTMETQRRMTNKSEARD